MTQHILAISNYLQSPIDGLLSFFKNYKTNRQIRKRRNQTIKELSCLTDHELNDIGIARGDIRAIASKDPEYKRTIGDQANVVANPNMKGWV